MLSVQLLVVLLRTVLSFPFPQAVWVKVEPGEQTEEAQVLYGHDAVSEPRTQSVNDVLQDCRYVVVRSKFICVQDVVGEGGVVVEPVNPVVWGGSHHPSRDKLVKVLD
jgi:hypothetical protein